MNRSYSLCVKKSVNWRVSLYWHWPVGCTRLIFELDLILWVSKEALIRESHSTDIGRPVALDLHRSKNSGVLPWYPQFLWRQINPFSALLIGPTIFKDCKIEGAKHSSQISNYKYTIMIKMIKKYPEIQQTKCSISLILILNVYN